jgi:hypothetical protein
MTARRIPYDNSRSNSHGLFFFLIFLSLFSGLLGIHFT